VIEDHPLQREARGVIDPEGLEHGAPGDRVGVSQLEVLPHGNGAPVELRAGVHVAQHQRRSGVVGQSRQQEAGECGHTDEQPATTSAPRRPGTVLGRTGPGRRGGDDHCSS